MATFEVYDYKILPEDNIDARQFHFYFYVYDDLGKKIKENYVWITITKSLLGIWNKYLVLNQSVEEWEEAFAKFTLKLIENEVKEFSIHDIPEEKRIEFRYWTENAPEIHFDYREIENIEGYIILLKTK